MIRNARFWTWINGDWVKLTLMPDSSLTHYVGHRTDEGYHSETVTWEHDGDGVVMSCSTDGCDCDGRLSSESEFFCPLDRLQTEDREEEGILAPEWHKKTVWQRDYEAEKAGY